MIVILEYLILVNSCHYLSLCGVHIIESTLLMIFPEPRDHSHLIRSCYPTLNIHSLCWDSCPNVSLSVSYDLILASFPFVWFCFQSIHTSPIQTFVGKPHVLCVLELMLHWCYERHDAWLWLRACVCCIPIPIKSAFTFYWWTTHPWQGFCFLIKCLTAIYFDQLCAMMMISIAFCKLLISSILRQKNRPAQSGKTMKNSHV